MGLSMESSDLRNLSPDERRRALCVEFENAWKANQNPGIAEFLLRVPLDERAELLAELVEVEVRQRKDRGENVTAADYLDKFPNDSASLRNRLATDIESSEDQQDDTKTFQASRRNEPEIVVPSDMEDLDEFKVPSVPIRMLGRYELLKEIGRGGFGKVYLARDPLLNRYVAIKTMLPERVPGSNQHVRFLEEARKLAQLDHPRIVEVYDFGSEDDEHYIVSDWIPGGNLGDLLKSRRFKWADAATMVAEIAEGLEHAHANQIFHRDIKPQNILIDKQGLPKIADFGLAITAEEQLKKPNSNAGTYTHMAPEVFTGGNPGVSARSDIYSLGCIFYQLLTHLPLFAVKTDIEWKYLAQNRNPVAPRKHDEDIPLSIEQICLKCLEKDPAKRFASAAEVASELRTHVALELQSQADRDRRLKALLEAQPQAVQDIQPNSVGETPMPTGGKKDSKVPAQINRLWIWTFALCLLLVGVALAIWPPNFVRIADDGSPTGEIESVPHHEKTNPAPNSIKRQALPLTLTDPDQFPDHSEQENLVLPSNEWIKLLMKPPKVLLWKKGNLSSAIQYCFPPKSELFASNNSLALLELGQIEKPNYDLTVNLQLNGIEGGLGLFLGHKDLVASRPDHKRCQLVLLERVENGHPNQLNVVLLSTTLDATGSRIARDRIMLSGPHTMLQNECMLKVEIRKGFLVGVQWDNDPVKPLIHEKFNGILTEDFTGKFGLAVSSGSGFFRQVHIRVID